eukprot:m.69073 g.69073  ORF g.69073 m.69073 type:complete len:455 (+) comp14223_c2_seq4:126-1490(+)
MSRFAGDNYHEGSTEDVLAKDNRTFRDRISVLENENRFLRKSVYDLNMKLALARAIPGRRVPHFDVDAMLESDKGELPAELEEQAGSANKQDSRYFSFKFELRGHAGAVYCVRFSPNGALLATASFDKTVKIWDVMLRKEVLTVRGHNLNVLDLSWSTDSSRVVSGSYDRTVRLALAETGQELARRETPGLVQCVAFSPANSDVFFAGTTKKQIHLFDVRGDSSANVAIDNETMVNTIYPYRSDHLLITGDAGGLIKTWDIRSLKCMDTVLVDDLRHPISHMSASANQAADEEGRYLAVNCYDNLLRVYDRGAEPPKSRLQLTHSAGGHIVKNFPIRCSFFHGSEHHTATRVTESVGGDLNTSTNDLDADDIGVSHATSIHTSLLLASGSADNNVYLFDVEGREGSASQLQRMSGHTGRVYGIHFHPTQPMLASSSADGTVRVWAAKAKRPDRL